jgi:hypothetical protein
MKLIYALALLPTLAQAQDLTIYKCDYRIASKEGRIFTMSGNIVADDAARDSAAYATTYLTLAPNQLSGDTTEARILVTSDGYNPITLHRAGGSATTLAFSELKADGGELGYTGENGTSYLISCKKR